MNETTEIKKYFVYLQPPLAKIDGFEFLHIKDIETMSLLSLDYVYIYDLLDYIDEQSCEKTLKLIKSRLKTNGRLIFQGTDIQSLSASLIYGQIELATFKSMIYGTGKKTSYTISNIKTILNDISGLEISKIQFINGSQYYIECVKYE